MMKCLIVALVLVMTSSIRTVGVIAFLVAVEPHRPHLFLSSSDDEEVFVRRRLSDLPSFLRKTTTTTNKKDTNVQSRRDLLRAATESVAGAVGGGGVLVAALGTRPRVASATSIEGVLVPPSSAFLPSGLLDSRVQGNVLAPPPYGMEGPDIFYPEWFVGTWKVTSLTKEIQAPCGVALFGGNITYTNAVQDIGSVLRYESRFIRDDVGRVIADREYNVKSIAKVALGENSVVNVGTSTPNKFSCILAPKGAPSMLSVDLIVLNRRQEPISSSQFDCSEVVREIVSPMDRPKKQQQVSPILKEIETTSLYTYDLEQDVVHCTQRSAAFLLPSNENPLAMRMWQASGGKAIDVRYYDVTYNRS